MSTRERRRLRRRRRHPIRGPSRSRTTRRASTRSRTAAARAPVKLLRWMEKRADKLRRRRRTGARALALPRRQDLERDEPDAFYSAEVEQLKTNQTVATRRRSCQCHAWETSVHPDPRGASLLPSSTRSEGTDDARRRRAAPKPAFSGGILRLLLSFQRDPTLFEASETPEAKEEGAERDAFIAALKAKTAFYGGEAYDKSRARRRVALQSRPRQYGGVVRARWDDGRPANRDAGGIERAGLPPERVADVRKQRRDAHQARR